MEPRAALLPALLLAALAALADEAPPPALRLVQPSTAGALRALRDSLGDQGWRVVRRLNRRDDDALRPGIRLVVPLRGGDSLAHSPFPPAFGAARDSARLVLVSLRVQAFAAYDSGKLVRWGPVSSGRRTRVTPTGLFHTNWKARERVSADDSAWVLRWYVNLRNRDGVSMHQYALPGRPASHACVRLLEEDARWLYDWCDTWTLRDARTVLRHGTPVVVFGAYDWSAAPPWLRAAADPSAATLAPAEIDEATRVMHSPGQAW